MAMREIWCPDEGDQGLNEGDFSKLQKGVLKQLIEVFNPLHSGGLSYSPFCTLSCFDRLNLFKMMYIFHILINSADTDEMPLFGSSLFANVPFTNT